MLASLKMIDVVGLASTSNDRQCFSHECCGDHVTLNMISITMGSAAREERSKIKD